MYTAVLTFALLFAGPDVDPFPALYGERVPTKRADFCEQFTAPAHHMSVLKLLNKTLRTEEAVKKGVMIVDFDVRCEMEPGV